MNISVHQQLLKEWQAGQVDSAVLIQELRALVSQMNLPQKYPDALEGVLSRIESSSLFTEESCSFSKKDLAHALEVWLIKADEYQSKGSI